MNKTGIAVFNCAPIGLMRLDDGGLRVVAAFYPDPKTHGRLEERLKAVFDLADNHHTTVREAYDKLPGLLGIPADHFTLLSLTEERAPLPPLPEGVVS